MVWWTAFMMGLIGSLHCVGMCGPIALALPYHSEYKLQTIGNILLYQFGRILTYSLIGLVLGTLGMGLVLAGMQTYLSLGLGIVLLLAVIFSINLERQFLKLPFLNRLNFWVKSQLGQLMKKGSGSKLFLVGLLNGLLPCGLVYMAVVGALTTSNSTSGALYMASFGLGTLPLMLATSLAGQFIGISWRRKMRSLVPVFLVLIAMLFIYRGMNFYIPVEMRFLDDMNNIPMCH
ncbi:MAG: sulfite exporter TauE/SafE family protein [Bacteroidota bacterium]